MSLMLRRSFVGDNRVPARRARARRHGARTPLRLHLELLEERCVPSLTTGVNEDLLLPLVQSSAVVPIQTLSGQQFDGPVAVFGAESPEDVRITLQWGDGQESVAHLSRPFPSLDAAIADFASSFLAGQAATDTTQTPAGGSRQWYVVLGVHTFTQGGSFSLTLSVEESEDNKVIVAAWTLAAGTLSANGVPGLILPARPLILTLEAAPTGPVESAGDPGNLGEGEAILENLQLFEFVVPAVPPVHSASPPPGPTTPQPGTSPPPSSPRPVSGPTNAPPPGTSAPPTPVLGPGALVPPAPSVQARIAQGHQPTVDTRGQLTWTRTADYRFSQAVVVQVLQAASTAPNYTAVALRIQIPAAVARAPHRSNAVDGVPAGDAGPQVVVARSGVSEESTDEGAPLPGSSAAPVPEIVVEAEYFARLQLLQAPGPAALPAPCGTPPRAPHAQDAEERGEATLFARPQSDSESIHLLAAWLVLQSLCVGLGRWLFPSSRKESDRYRDWPPPGLSGYSA